MVISQTFKLHGIHRAILEGRYRQLEFLVQLGSDVNYEARDGLKPLLRCCFVEREKLAVIMFRFLRSKGADVNCKDRFGRGVVTLAVLNDKLNLTRMLCRDDEVNIIDRDRRGYTALHHASEQGRLKTIEVLIFQMKRLHIDLDIQANGGFTPLLCACRQGMVEAAELLIRNGASTSLRDCENHRNAQEWLAATTAITKNRSTADQARKRPRTSRSRSSSRETVKSDNAKTKTDSEDGTKERHLNNRSRPPKSAILPRGSNSAVEKRVTEKRQLPSRAKSCPDLHRSPEFVEEAFITEFPRSEVSFRTDSERVLCTLINSYGVQKNSSYRKSFKPECSKDMNAKTWIQSGEPKPQNTSPRPQTGTLKSRSKFQLAHDAVRAMLTMSKSSLTRQNSRSGIMRPGSAQSQKGSGGSIAEFRRNKSKLSLLVQTEPTVPE